MNHRPTTRPLSTKGYQRTDCIIIPRTLGRFGKDPCNLKERMCGRVPNTEPLTRHYEVLKAYERPPDPYVASLKAAVSSWACGNSWIYQTPRRSRYATWCAHLPYAPTPLWMRAHCEGDACAQYCIMIPVLGTGPTGRGS